MKRIDAAQVAVPERMSCRVDDVLVRNDHLTVVCAGSPAVLVYGYAAQPMNVGDVISVPLRDVRRDPDVVLYKDLKEGRWYVSADAGVAARG